MIKEHLIIPNYPVLSFPGLSYELLNKKIPDYIATTKWYIRVGISSLFVLIAAITSISCYYFELINDLFYLSTLSVLLLLYMITMPMFTRLFISSEYITKKTRRSKRKFFYRLLSNTTIENRRMIANNILEALKSDEWRLYINSGNRIDPARTVYCCQEISKIATDLTTTNPRKFCRAMYKVMNNQRGSVRYFFDTLIMLGEKEFNKKDVTKPKIRNTKKLLMENFFMHR